jgi:hypothetical protein
MRIKIIGENNCARATRHLLRLAGFAVTEFLPGDALAGGPLAGYAITIDLAPAHSTPDSSTRPDPPTQVHASVSEEAPRSLRDASSPASAKTLADLPVLAKAASIHFDSVDSALEAAVLRHVAELSAAPVIVDRPGGVVHSDRELRIVAPCTGDAKVDEAAAVAIEFGVLRGLLDLTAPDSFRPSAGGITAGKAAEGLAPSRSVGGRKWWPFWTVLLVVGLGLLRASLAAAPARIVENAGKGPCRARLQAGASDASACSPEGERYIGTLLQAASFASITESHRLKPVPLVRALAAQEQVAMGQGLKITDGVNFLVVDPCKGQAKFYASINQTANTQLVAGTASKKIYVCSIQVVAAAAANVAVVEGTGSVCATGTAGVSGFGGATAATGWNFAANGGIALGNGDSSLGAESAGGDNLCIFNSGSGQISGGISYVVE